MARDPNEKIKKVYFAWSSHEKFRWVPNWDRVWRDNYSGIRFRVVKWGWWFWTVRRNRRHQTNG